MKPAKHNQHYGQAGFGCHAMSSKLWELAWPLSGMEVLTFTKELIITSFVGHLGPLALSALVLAQTLYNVLGNAPMLGMVAAMETFCGQAFGARKHAMLGVVLQRALILVLLTCIGCVAAWTCTEALLIKMGQDPNICHIAFRLTMLLAPCLIMDGVEQCLRRYLSAQCVVLPLMIATMIATLLTPLYLWVFIIRWKWGVNGAAVAWNCVQVTSLGLLMLYVLYHNRTQDQSRKTWTGFSGEALQDWGQYIRVAIPSIVMICLDWWTFEIIVLLSGLLPNPEVTMSMMGITFNLHALCFMAAHGLSGAASTRVGNELGAGRARMAWLTTQVAVLMGTSIMAVSSGWLVAFRQHIGQLFTTDTAVIALTAQAVVPLAASLIGEGANTVMAGVLRGCGRQKVGAIVNLVLYWGVGLPFSCFLAFTMNLGAMGLWIGLACTSSLQALLLALAVFSFDWQAEATHARTLVGETGAGESEPLQPLARASNASSKAGRGISAASILDIDSTDLGLDTNEFFGLFL